MIDWKGSSSVITEFQNPKLNELMEQKRAEVMKKLRYFMGDLPPDEMAQMKARLEIEAEERSKYCPECGKEW